MASWSGVNEYNLNKVGAYHMIGNDDYEPQRNNNFEIHIYGLNNLRTVDGKMKVPQDVAEESLTLSANPRQSEQCIRPGRAPDLRKGRLLYQNYGKRRLPEPGISERHGFFSGYGA